MEDQPTGDRFSHDLPKELAYCHIDVFEKLELEQKQWLGALAMSFLFPKVAIEGQFTPKHLKYMQNRLAEMKCEFSATKNRILFENPRQVTGDSAEFCELFIRVCRVKYIPDQVMPQNVRKRLISLGFLIETKLKT